MASLSFFINEALSNDFITTPFFLHSTISYRYCNYPLGRSSNPSPFLAVSSYIDRKNLLKGKNPLTHIWICDLMFINPFQRRWKARNGLRGPKGPFLLKKPLSPPSINPS
jgi:hypothetical protein